MPRDCVEHYVSGEAAWKVGLVGLFIRRRGIVGASAASIATMGVPWWWPTELGLDSTVRVDLRYIAGLALVAGSALLISGLIYLRRRARRSLAIKSLLHELAHFIRDSYSEYSMALQAPALPDLQEERNFKHMASDLCERAAAYFRELLGDRTIAAAVRLAVSLDDDRIVYRTVARSTGLSVARAKSSDDIPFEQGIPRFLSADKGKQGVLIYNDLMAAAEMGTYKSTRNDQIFPDEVVSMMVAPLNAWEGQATSMVGLLHITSRRRRAFSIIHVDSMRFMADTIASAIASIVQQLSQSNRMPSFERATP